MDRRQLLVGGAVGVLASVGLARSAAAASALPREGVPGTLHRTRTLPGSATVPDTAFPLTHLGLDWAGGAAPVVRLRTAAGWSGWTTAEGCSAGRDDALPGQGALVAAGGALGYEVRASGPVRVGELNVVDGPVRPATRGARVASDFCGAPLRAAYRNRAAWGADESLRFDESGVNRYPDDFHPVQTLTVHHTVTAVDDPDPAATVRGIYASHTVARDFGDLGYHLLIDAGGTVYEGRSSGADPFPVFGGDPVPGQRPRANNAAHVSGFNAGNVGVALLGEFTDAVPSDAALDSLVVVLAVLSRICGLDPLGRTAYVNPINGATRTVDTICTHRDWAVTACPGDRLYPLVPGIRERVADLARTVRVAIPS